jgi:hypothetical protein
LILHLLKGNKLSFIKRIPTLEQIAPVYAVIVVMIYSWTLLRFFWRLSSWFYFSSLGEIAVIFNYMIAVNFFESLFVLIAPVIMSLFLPSRWFYNNFTAKGSLLVVLGLGYFMYFDNHLNSQTPFPLDLVYITPIIGGAILVIVFLLGSLQFINKILYEVTNRLIIFLYISIPVSILSLLVVLIRNIF